MNNAFFQNMVVKLICSSWNNYKANVYLSPPPPPLPQGTDAQGTDDLILVHQKVHHGVVSARKGLVFKFCF
jgi:hypothetical protein